MKISEIPSFREYRFRTIRYQRAINGKLLNLLPNTFTGDSLIGYSNDQNVFGVNVLIFKIPIAGAKITKIIEPW